MAASATVAIMATSAATSIGTIAIADQLNHLRGRVPLSDGDIARASAADEATVRAWLTHTELPQGTQANRLVELIAIVEMAQESTRPDAIPGWLNRNVPALEDRVPLDVIAAGGYKRVMDLVAGAAAGVFT